MVPQQDVIKAIKQLIKAAEAMYPLYEDESRMEMYEEEMEALENAANYARGILLAMGDPYRD